MSTGATPVSIPRTALLLMTPSLVVSFFLVAGPQLRAPPVFRLIQLAPDDSLSPRVNRYNKTQNTARQMILSHHGPNGIGKRITNSHTRHDQPFDAGALAWTSLLPGFSICGVVRRPSLRAAPAFPSAAITTRGLPHLFCESCRKD